MLRFFFSVVVSLFALGCSGQSIVSWWHVDSLEDFRDCQLRLASDGTTLLKACELDARLWSQTRRLDNGDLVDSNTIQSFDFYLRPLVNGMFKSQAGFWRIIGEEGAAGIVIYDLLPSLDTQQVSVEFGVGLIATESATINDTTYLGLHADSFICLMAIAPDFSRTLTCVPNPEGLKIVGIEIDGPYVYLAVDGSFLVPGFSRNEIGLMKFDRMNGVHLWTSVFYGNPGLGYAYAEKMHLLSNGDIVVVGKNNEGALSGFDLITIRFDGETGNQNWRHAFSYSSDFYKDFYLTSLTDEADRVHILGSEGKVPLDDVFHYTLDSSGNLIDSGLVAGLDLRFAEAVSNTSSFSLLGVRGINDNVFARIATSGEIISQPSIAPIDTMDLDLSIEILESDGVTFLKGVAGESLVLARIDEEITGLEGETSSGFSLNVRPNPSSGTFRVEIFSFEPNLRIEVFDIYGRSILEQAFSNSEEVSIDGYGLHIICIRSESGALLESQKILLY